MAKERYGFDIVEGYTEQPVRKKGSLSCEALPEAAKVSTPGERAEFITRRLKEAAETDTWVTAPQLTEEWLERAGEVSTSSKVKARIRQTIGEWLRKENNKGSLDQTKAWIDHPPTDGWRWKPILLKGPDGRRWDPAMVQGLQDK